MTDYVSFFLNSGRGVMQYETLEVSHPGFSRVFRFVRRAADLVARLETGEMVTFERIPMRVRRLTSAGRLDYGIGVDLGDLGELLPAELDRVRAAGTHSIRPVVVHRVYRSDDLSGPMLGPIRLEVDSISRAREGASFEARAPALHLNKTGELYTVERFLSLRGAL